LNGIQHFRPQMPFCTYSHENIELPLNLSIRGGAKQVCVQIICDAYDKYLTQQQDKKINQFYQPESETSGLNTRNLRVCQAELAKNNISL
jgi:hypothetical protein